MTRESTLWLAEQGAKIGGTDAIGWDRPFPVMVADYQRTKDKRFIWDAHFACRDVEFYVVQQLANLDKLPPHGFKVSFFPVLLVGASAAPSRVVAFPLDCTAPPVVPEQNHQLQNTKKGTHAWCLFLVIAARMVFWLISLGTSRSSGQSLIRITS